MMDVSSITLGALGMTVLTEAVVFLREQAGEAVRRHHEGRDSHRDPAELDVAVLDRPLDLTMVDSQVIAAELASLTALCAQLAEYGVDRALADPRDVELLTRVHALRLLLERAYGRRITFKGEDRPSTGTPLSASPVEGHPAGISVAANGHGAVAVGGANYGSINVTR